MERAGVQAEALGELSKRAFNGRLLAQHAAHKSISPPGCPT